VRPGQLGGLRVPARNALLADVVPAEAYGRAYGFERMMDNLGAIVGPLLALGLVSLFSVRTAILLSVIPGLLAAVAIVYAIRLAKLPKATERKKLRFQVRPVLKGQLGRVMAGFTVFEMGNVTATRLILRATDVLTPGRGVDGATQISIALYVVYNIAATITLLPAGGFVDKLGPRRPLLVTAAGVAAFLLATACSRSPDR
jgi:MFS family permease